MNTKFLKTKQYMDWKEVTAEVEKIAGKSVRDWSDFFNKEHPTPREYQDFWHVICDFEDIPEESFRTINFQDLSDETDKAWVKEICAIYQAVIQSDEATFFFEW